MTSPQGPKQPVDNFVDNYPDNPADNLGDKFVDIIRAPAVTAYCTATLFPRIVTSVSDTRIAMAATLTTPLRHSCRIKR